MAELELESGTAEVKDPKAEIVAMRSLKRNTWAAVIDSGGFGAALGFIGYSTVLPTMALALTKSEPYVGLITTLWSGMWLLPQLPAGRRLAGRVYNKPVLIKAAFFSRIALMAMAFALLLPINPMLLAVLLPIAIIIFRGLDAVAAVAWFDVISKAFLPHVRGKILGWTQSAAFGAQFLSSFVVAWALSTSGPAFPNNYALLMGLSAIFVLASWVALTFYVEPRGESINNPFANLRLREHVGHILKTDRSFRLNAIGRILIGGIGFATPFYVVQATQVLNVPSDTIGLFLAAQTVGGVVSSLILGPISQRRGSHIVVRATMILGVIPPILGLLLFIFAQNNVTLATLGTVLIFAAMGATDGSFLLGFLQHVLDIAPPGQRTAYTGLSNTIGGLTVIAPTIGGLLLQATSFPALFIITMLAPLAGLLVVLRIPKVIREA
ncbi:MAG TPA: MFS transporter [Anaerolineae bacterium]|nr:MFS transporter [Anaerolineae bacterium]